MFMNDSIESVLYDTLIIRTMQVYVLGSYRSKAVVSSGR